MGFATSITYSYLRKPKAALFAMQLLVPLMIVSSLWVADVSKGLALTLAIVGVVMYVLIFVLNRFRFLEDNNK